MVVLSLTTSPSAGYVVDDSIDRIDFTRLTTVLSQQYWSHGATMEHIVACAEGSWCFGLYSAVGLMVGYLRLVTDRHSFYCVSDLFIEEDLQGQGLGEFLIRTALAQSGIADSGCGFLSTGDARSPSFFTRTAGFQVISEADEVFPDGLHGTRWTMLRPPGKLLPTLAYRLMPIAANTKKPEPLPAPAPAGGLGRGAACALASAAAVCGYVLGARR
jgi:ribosomal protein S18 acetylase RimI-like enzyme